MPSLRSIAVIKWPFESDAKIPAEYGFNIQPDMLADQNLISLAKESIVSSGRSVVDPRGANGKRTAGK